MELTELAHSIPLSQAESSSRIWQMLAPIKHDYEHVQHNGPRNFIQKLSDDTNGWLNPATGLTEIGFGFSISGSNDLNSWGGILKTMGGMMCDFADGPVARALKVQSETGEKADATSDKIKLAYALYKIWQLDLAPKPLVAAIGIQNGMNGAVTLADRRLNKDRSIMHPSWLGKRTIFLQEWGLGLHVIGNQLAKSNDKRGKMIKRAGSILGWSGVATGAVTTGAYATVLWASRQ